MWQPKIVAAQAFAAGHFAVAYADLEPDDPFSAILEYDDAFPQPWSRTDVARDIVAIAAAPPHASWRFAAASDEGDVYLIGEGEPVHEKIVGAGVASLDATGAGAILALATIDDTLYAAGQSAQLYRRQGAGRWDRIDVGVGAEAGFKPTTLRRIAGRSASEIYLLGVAARDTPGMDDATQQKLTEENDWGALAEVYEKLATEGDAAFVDEGRVHHFDGKAWRRLALPTAAVLNDAKVTVSGLRLVGSNGAILDGDAARGFRSVGPKTNDTFLSIAALGRDDVLASDYALHVFDGRTLTPLKPRLRRAPPTPLKVQAFESTLVYFDVKQGVHRFDGSTWTKIEIPSELLQRSFKGLKRP
jgi:hypothetical protein